MLKLNDITLYFVRHGETDWNVERRLQGTTDIPLNDKGRAQAARHGKVMAELDVDWSKFQFHASPLVRTSETMDIVRQQIGISAAEPIYDDLLKEAHFGNWEGQTWPQIVENSPEAHAAYLKDSWTRAPHNGETHQDIADRLIAWSGTLTQDTVVVSHGMVSRVLRSLYLDLDRADVLSLSTPQTKFYRFANGQVDTI